MGCCWSATVAGAAARTGARPAGSSTPARPCSRAWPGGPGGDRPGRHRLGRAGLRDPGRGARPGLEPAGGGPPGAGLRGRRGASTIPTASWSTPASWRSTTARRSSTAATVGRRAAGGVARRAMGPAARVRTSYLVAGATSGASRWSSPGMSRDRADDRPAILHVDMDAFFVAVELLAGPELRGPARRRRRHRAPAASWPRPPTRPGPTASTRPCPRCGPGGSAPMPSSCPATTSTTARSARGSWPSSRRSRRWSSRSRSTRRSSTSPGARRLFGDRPGRSRVKIRAGGARPGGPHLLGGRGARPSSWPSWRRRRPSRSSAPTASGPASAWWSCRPEVSSRFLHPLPVQALWGVGPADPRAPRPPRRRHGRRPGRPAARRR